MSSIRGGRSLKCALLQPASEVSMTIPSSFAVRFWLLISAAMVAVLWLFKPVLTPFLTGIVVAYFLEPMVSAVERRGVSRWIGSLLVLILFFLFVVAVLLLMVPVLSHQIVNLIDSLPEYISVLREQYMPWAQSWLSRFSIQDVDKIREAAAQSTGDAVGLVGKTLHHIVSRSFAFIDAIMLSILAPVTAYYVLRDWNNFIKAVDDLIPRRHHKIVREQMADIDQTLSGFIRGQAMVCAVLVFIYSAGLALCGLKYGATIGIVAGVLTIIPYVGTVFGWATSFILACVQFDGDWMRIGAVISVFAIGHVLESYVLTPKFVGDRVGLHPVWILFALMAGMELMGFFGALIAVPVAAVVGVLVRFAARQYKANAVYVK